MKYLLDTNTCVAYLRARQPRLRAKLAGMNQDLIALCAVVKAELYNGARKSAQPEKAQASLAKFYSAFVSLPFDDRAAEEYGRIRARLEKQGTPIGPYDMMIAAIALSNNLILSRWTKVI